MSNSSTYTGKQKTQSLNDFSESELTQKRFIKASYAPDFSKNNPYQKQLYEKLEQSGITLEGIDRRKIFLPTIIKRGDTDILHLHWLHAYFRAESAIGSLLKLVRFLSGLTILKLRGTKIVWTAHNLKNHENLYPLSDRICTLSVSKLADAIIAHSYAAKSELCQTFHIKNTEKVFVVPHGNYVEAYDNRISRQEARKQLEIPESSVVFLFFGMIRWYKGVPELIDAFQKLRSKDAYLVIAGRFRNKDKGLENLIQEKVKGNKNIKQVLGFIPEEEVQTYMNASDVVLFPYRKSLTSGALILAMSFRRACVAPKLGCMEEVLDETGSFLYDPSSSDGLAHALENVLHRTHDLPDMGEHNYQLAAEWSWETVAQMTLDVYRSCVERA
ncbi:glycosyl transferase, group 1 family protein [Synechococcus sp. PCC 7335]|uniref:glycosyltransferase n=1 Tax=Synechococcus sp. (strain ATCC 29403 / PCC 7335) TaxID=91464 RepID=UPI00017ED1EC|nr:glycosyltransferase [Synechococcus sp. PCC 7335]EDX86696.1 glycosyl transferase, group 1 family protein [Synechococcus sp. PCC 7335]